MRWMVAFTIVVSLVVIDEASYRGIHLDAAQRMFSRIFVSFGLV
jgi:hypothetical protein